MNIVIYINFKEQTLMMAPRIAASRVGSPRIQGLAVQVAATLDLRRHRTGAHGLEPEAGLRPISSRCCKSTDLQPARARFTLFGVPTAPPVHSLWARVHSLT